MLKIVRSTKNLNYKTTTSFISMSLKNEQITQYYTVNPSLHGLLIGKKGSRLKQLTKETNTRIEVKRGTDQVMIRGEPDNVERAKMAIKYAIRPRRPTHFLSLPIPSVSHSLEVLYSKMDTVDPSALVSPANFHITLGVLSLLDQVQVEQAVKYLKEHGPIIVDSVLEKPLNIKLQNLAIMQSDPAETHVMYVEPQDDAQTLFRFCTEVIEKMIQGGFMQRENRPLKLHATIVNTSHSKKGKSRIAFDARSILQNYGQVDFGQVRLDKLHLMKMGRTGPEKTYQSEGCILLK